MRTLFISDLHLSDKRPDLIRALVHFLEHETHDCSELYLLGDIFDAWIGDDFYHPALQPAIEALAACQAKGISVYLQHGNRDFLMGDKLAKRVNATLLPEAKTITLPDSSQALVMHGDQLCTDDAEYQSFRTMVRNPAWQQMFLDKPLEERIEIARSLREQSQLENADKSYEIMDVNEDAVSAALSNANTNLLIHGHTHRPAIHTLSELNATRIVLGDWDTDVWYLDCTKAGCNLKSYPLPSA